MTALPFSWRNATTSDLDAIKRISDVIHATLPERLEIFEEKFRLFPPGCRVLCRQAEIVGYGFSHPWLQNSIPPLDEFLKVLPPHPDCMFIHDVVVLPAARGHNASGKYVGRIVSVGRSVDVRMIALVSVYSTGPLWARHGFTVAEAPCLREKLRSYGPDARYMVRPIG
jgi:Acetyltransferase (GNAT) family